MTCLVTLGVTFSVIRSNNVVTNLLFCLKTVVVSLSLVKTLPVHVTAFVSHHLKFLANQLLPEVRFIHKYKFSCPAEYCLSKVNSYQAQRVDNLRIQRM